MSRYHLVRRFTRQFGLPPHAYQIHLRIKRACTLLRLNHLPSEAGVAVWFPDPTHFAPPFNKRMGGKPVPYFDGPDLTVDGFEARPSFSCFQSLSRPQNLP